MTASTRLAQEFLRHAAEFHDAAVRLCHRKPFLFHPTFYCALHSIELALKAHLAYAGFGPNKLRSKPLGHDIDALLQAATKQTTLDKSGLNAFDRKAISWGGKDYSKKCFEYPSSCIDTPDRKMALNRTQANKERSESHCCAVSTDTTPEIPRECTNYKIIRELAR